MNDEISHAFLFFEFIALFVTLLLTKSWVTWMRRRKRVLSGETPMDLFLALWSGKEEDELYTWYKVRALLIQHDASESEIRFIEDQIRGISTESIKGNTLINPIGDIQG